MKITLLAIGALLAAAPAADAASIQAAVDVGQSTEGRVQQAGPAAFTAIKDPAVAFNVTLADDNGEAGRSCFTVLTRTTGASEFTGDGSATCPDTATSLTRLTFLESTEVKFAVVSGEGNSPAETAPIAIRVGPKVTWEVVDGAKSGTLALQVVVEGTGEGFGGKVEVRQKGKLIATKTVTPAGVLAFKVRGKRAKAGLDPKRPTEVRYVSPSARWVNVEGVVPKLKRSRYGAFTKLG